MNVIPFDRFIQARKRKALRMEQAFIEACERVLEEHKPEDMEELIEKAKSQVEREERQ